MSKDIPVFRSAIHPDRKAQFQAVAMPKRDIKDTRSKLVTCCTNCGKLGDDEGVELKTCSSCKSVSYCSRDCQKQNWPFHKVHCGRVDGPGIEKLIKSFNANKLLFHWLQVCLILEFNFLNERCVDRPLLAHIDVGIEPTKITEFMNLFTYGTKFDKENMQGMLQLDLLSSERSGMPPRPLTEVNLKLWERSRAEADAEGNSENPVVLVQYVNNCAQAISCPVVITDEAFEEARHAEPFVMCSALTGKETKKPLSVDSILEYINTHIRSDLRDQLLLRATMRPSDKEMIRDAGRNKNAHAPQALRLKMAREGVYVSHRRIVASV